MAALARIFCLPYTLQAHDQFVLPDYSTDAFFATRSIIIFEQIYRLWCTIRCPTYRYHDSWETFFLTISLSSPWKPALTCWDRSPSLYPESVKVLVPPPSTAISISCFRVHGLKLLWICEGADEEQGAGNVRERELRMWEGSWFPWRFGVCLTRFIQDPN